MGFGVKVEVGIGLVLNLTVEISCKQGEVLYHKPA